MRTTNIQRTYKDSLFRMIFREKKELLNLSALECVVTYLNVNYGHNQKIMSECQKLKEYAFLIDQIRRQLEAGKQLKAAVDYAVGFCIHQGILADFLRKHRAEVTNVILTEYDQERHIKNEKQTSYSEGYKEGSIKTAIQIYKDFGMEDAEIYENIMKKFGLTEEEAKILLETKE